MRGHVDPGTEKAVGAEVRHSRAETGRRVGAMDDGLCPRGGSSLNMYPKHFWARLHLCGSWGCMYVTCVSQKKRNHDGWHEGVHEGVHAMMHGGCSGRQRHGNSPYGVLGCFEPSPALHSTNMRRADFSSSGRLDGYRDGH